MNYAKPLRAEELAQLAGMGVSSLHDHFRALTAMSGRVLMDGLDAASAPFEVGYESASQFNREYSRFFGQPNARHSNSSLAKCSSVGVGSVPMV